MKELSEGETNPTPILLYWGHILVEEIATEAEFLEKNLFTSGTKMAASVIFYGEISKKCLEFVRKNSKFVADYNFAKQKEDMIFYLAEEA